MHGLSLVTLTKFYHMTKNREVMIDRNNNLKIYSRCSQTVSFEILGLKVLNIHGIMEERTVQNLLKGLIVSLQMMPGVVSLHKLPSPMAQSHIQTTFQFGSS